MATTTNYGWTTPDDTALVKDGAAAIRTLGSSVDTTTKNLNPETTLGDIAYRSSTSNVNTRLGIGTTGQILTVAGGVPSWATPAGGGGMTLLSTTTLSGASTTISGISGSYKDLVAIIFGVTNASSDDTFICKPNNAATSSVICADTSAFRTSDTDIILTGKSVHPSRTNANNAYALQFSNYASTTAFKPIIWSGFFVTATPANKPIWGGGAFRSNSAITSLVFASEGGDLSTGTVLLYGVS